VGNKPAMPSISPLENLIFMIIAKNIHKSFGELEVLKGVDLHVKKGEIVSIVGPSGAGKTTLLQIIGTLDKSNAGEVLLNGIDFKMLNEQDLSAFRNKHIGFIFQFHQLLPEFTALENVIIPALIARKDVKEATKKAKEILSYLQLTDRMDHKPNELSGGEKQRIAVARALINNPEIILADEPSGSLDTKNRDELHKLLFDLRDKFGLTIVIVTHDKELAALSDRVIEMKDGIVHMPIN
jgi:lipoprotein-releasing system ATP-binding protein